MTFEQFQQTRQWSDDVALLIDCDLGGKVSGQVYLCDDWGALYIEAAHSIDGATGPYVLTIGNSQKFGELESLERELYEFAERASVCGQVTNMIKVTSRADAIAIATKYVARFGYGFHPDTRGGDYHPSLTVDEAAEYDRDMDVLFAVEDGCDPYEIAARAMEDHDLRPTPQPT